VQEAKAKLLLSCDKEGQVYPVIIRHQKSHRKEVHP
jgi:hypothetical protein